MLNGLLKREKVSLTFNEDIAEKWGEMLLRQMRIKSKIGIQSQRVAKEQRTRKESEVPTRNKGRRFFYA